MNETSNKTPISQTQDNAILFSGWLLLFSVILIEGFVTISVEILSIRQLIPVVGSSVIVTSLIIGIFLLFLAIGYWRGGSHTEQYYRVLQKNFTKAAILIGIGLSYTFVILFFGLVEKFLTSQLLFVLTLYLLLIIAPVVYWLGQTVPITTNLFRKQLSVGAISGKVLFLSTIGSFLGAVLTSLLLMNFLGVAWTVFINVCALIVLITMVSFQFTGNLMRFFILAVSLWVIYEVNIDFERIAFLRTNNYANYQVRPVNFLGVGKGFFINNSFSSFLSDQKKGAPYIELIKRLLFNQLSLTNNDILVLGAGGFTLSAETTNNNRFTYVDIDKDIKPTVEKSFLPDIKGEFIAEDARLFLAKTDKRYDVIVSDLYTHRMSIPPYLLTREHFQNIKRVLKPNGFAIFNVIANPLLTDSYSKRIDNTIAFIFSSCMRIPLEYVSRLTNVIYACHVSDEERDATVYTDNRNTATMDSFLSRS